VRLDAEEEAGAEEERKGVLKRGSGVGKSIEVWVGDMERVAQNWEFWALEDVLYGEEVVKTAVEAGEGHEVSDEVCVG